ncbi:hypothetical protein ACSXDL_02305 [Clostridium perfringens]|uniref:hypothetical protein n=1 Tax=Clostridium perfringens TaxID=1502 RepID=UPI003F41B8F7
MDILLCYANFNTILKQSQNILKFWYWQDIEKSNVFIRVMNLGIALFLSFCLLAWMYGESFNIILRSFISIYGVLCFMSFWPVSYLLDEKDKVKGSTFYIFQNISVFFSIIILVVYILKNYDRVKS